MKIFIDHWITSEMGIARTGKTENVPVKKLIELINDTTKSIGEKRNDAKLLELQGTERITLMGNGNGWYISGAELNQITK